MNKVQQKYHGSVGSERLSIYDRESGVTAFNLTFDETHKRLNAYVEMYDALQAAHFALHQCCAVLSANDCEQVSSVMRDVRSAIDLSKP